MKERSVKVRKTDQKAREFVPPRPEGTVALSDAIVRDEETGETLVIAARLPRGRPTDLAGALRGWLQRSRRFGGTGRLSGIENQAVTFGYAPAAPLRQRFGCGLTRFMADEVNGSAALHELGQAAWSLVNEHAPEIAEEHLRLVGEVPEDWLLPCGEETIPWTSGIVNRSAALPLHRDSGNVAGSWSAMLVLRSGMGGGELYCPEIDTYFRCDDGDVLIFCGQKILHGVTPLVRARPEDYRYSIIYYAKSAFIGAGTIEEERIKAKCKATESFERTAESTPEGVELIQCRRYPIQMYAREGSSDAKAIKEVIEDNGYQKPRRGFILEAGDRWLDGGVNCGAFTCLAHAVGVAQVVGYEADAENLAAARANFALNGVPFEARHAALMTDDFEGDSVTLHKCDEPGKEWRHSVVWERKKSTPHTVPAVRLSEAMAADDLDCLKLDIEGAEIDMLQSEHFPWSRARKLAFEWSFDVERRMAVLRKVLDRVETEFEHVVLSKGNLPWEQETYDFFPPQVLVYAWR